MPRKKKESNQEKIQFPNMFRVVGGDISLKRPGFCVLTVERQLDGTLRFLNVRTTCVDNKKNQKIEKGELLDEVLRAITFFFPDQESDGIETYYVREKYISKHNSTYESSIYEAVGITDWFLWRLKKSWYELYPVSIKKLVTGNGKADKTEVAAALSSYVGERTYATDDESDAVAAAVAWLIQQGQLQTVPRKAEETDVQA